MPPKRIRLALGGSRHQLLPNAIPTHHNSLFDEVSAPGTGDMNDNEEGSEEEVPQSTQQSTMESQHIYPPQVQLSRSIALPPESSNVDESIGRLGGRQPGHRNWQSYQERMLVSLVLEEKPFFTGAAKKWSIIASKLKKPRPSTTKTCELQRIVSPGKLQTPGCRSIQFNWWSKPPDSRLC
jgi:hypothetical protein